MPSRLLSAPDVACSEPTHQQLTRYKLTTHSLHRFHLHFTDTCIDRESVCIGNAIDWRAPALLPTTAHVVRSDHFSHSAPYSFGLIIEKADAIVMAKALRFSFDLLQPGHSELRYFLFRSARLSFHLLFSELCVCVCAVRSIVCLVFVTSID